MKNSSLKEIKEKLVKRLFNNKFGLDRTCKKWYGLTIRTTHLVWAINKCSGERLDIYKDQTLLGTLIYDYDKASSVNSADEYIRKYLQEECL